MTEYRAHFDARIVFVNGGSLDAAGFRLDVAGPTVSADEVGRPFVAHLGLALVDSIELSGFAVVAEPHRGSRGTPVAVEAARRVIDLSHTIEAGMVTYPGLPAPSIAPHLTRADSRLHYAPGVEFAMDTITLLGNTGTYLDSPYHRYAGGTDLAGLALETLVDLPAEVFRLTDARGRGIGAEVFLDRELRGSAVLLHTGWDVRFGTPAYAVGAPFLTEAGARHLVDAGVALVGIDSLNIDDAENGGTRPAHSLLLEAGIHVVEHLTGLSSVPPRGARFTAVPPKVRDFGTFPVRAFATVGGSGTS
ncbi:cyclase family protein [Microbacteriaceae bacterium VKM Ac-2855]|nr:cyclase family protein [Microbacteriaceae bacterium VKM Ac-2855]